MAVSNEDIEEGMVQMALRISELYQVIHRQNKELKKIKKIVKSIQSDIDDEFEMLPITT